MKPFKYIRVGDEMAAVATLQSEEQAVFIAGGTNLLDIMKLDVQSPASLVDINALPLTDITLDNDHVRIGALARNSDVAVHPLIRQRYPLLSEALLAGASPQLRNMATIGGNLLQRTRCYYFRDTVFSCNKRNPGTGCTALHSFNRLHAILGGSSECIATHPSDMCIALAALDAVIHTHGPHGTRSIPLQNFYLLPGDAPDRETVLEHGELITAVELPPSPFAHHTRYRKVRDRASYAFAVVSVAVALDLHDGLIRAVRIALGGVATVPWRAYEAETLLLGQAPTQENYHKAARIATQHAVPRQYNAFKIELTQRMIVETLIEVGAMA